MSKKNILHINISDSRGGASIAVLRLNQLMNKDAQFASKMLVLIKNTDYDSVFSFNCFRMQYARICNLLNNIFLKLRKYLGSFSVILYGNDIFSHQLIKEADVIYVHWINTGMLSWNTIEKIASIKKPIFLFCHDMWYFTGGCHQSNSCIQYITGCKSCPFFDNRFIQRRVSIQYNKKEKSYQYTNIQFILPSPNFYEKAVHSKIIDKSRMHFIPNVLDTDKYIPKPGIINKKHHIRLLYGALGGKSNPYKGWSDFIYLAEQINKNYPRNTVEFALFGYDFQPNEQKEVPFIFINYGIIYDEGKMIEMYQDADIFVFPSHQESFGQTLVEAMSCGVVPIAYNVGITDYLIENNVNGYIVNNKDKDGLFKAFENLMVSDLLTLKTNARKTIIDKLSPKLILEKHKKLILSSL